MNKKYKTKKIRKKLRTKKNNRSRKNSKTKKYRGGGKENTKPALKSSRVSSNEKFKKNVTFNPSLNTIRTFKSESEEELEEYPDCKATNWRTFPCRYKYTTFNTEDEYRNFVEWMKRNKAERSTINRSEHSNKVFKELEESERRDLENWNDMSINENEIQDQDLEDWNSISVMNS